MRYELKRVAPLRAANILALLYGLMMSIFSLIIFPFFLLASIFAPGDEMGGAGPFVAMIFLVLYPIMGLVMGWIGGLLSAAIYNLIIKMTGGFLFDLEASSTPPPGETVQQV